MSTTHHWNCDCDDCASTGPATSPTGPVAKELIICPAVRMPDGYVVRGHRHNDALGVAAGMPRYEKTKAVDVKQGFVTSTNRFVDRAEAHQIHIGKPGQLFSEDLY